MALEKNDLKSIKKIVDESVGKTENNLRSEFKTDLNKEIGSLRLDMNQGLENMDKKMDSNQKVVLQKIDEIRKMESEDIQAIYTDITKIKKRLPV
jgi:hypothetical protein